MNSLHNGIRRIRTMNAIHESALALFGSHYEVGPDVEDPLALLVRSAPIDTDKYPSILAIARAGVGVDKISLAKATAAGICVINTPGTNALSVAELVAAAVGNYYRNLDGAVAFTRSLDPELSDEAMDKLVEEEKKKIYIDVRL